MSELQRIPIFRYRRSPPHVPSGEHVRTCAYHLWEDRGRTHGFDQEDWFQAEQLLFIEQNYQTLVSCPLSSRKRHYFGNKQNRRCRFCGKTGREHFKLRAHALPESIGNRALLSNHECDECNEFFGNSLEDDFAKLLGLTRTLGRVRGKSGVPSYKNASEAFRIEWKAHKFEVRDSSSSPVATVDEKERTLNFTDATAPFVPIAVYKCLTKMALSVMPELDMQSFGATLRWLRDSDHAVDANRVERDVGVQLFKPGPVPDRVGRASLLRRREHASREIPYMLFVLVTQNFGFEIGIPFSGLDTRSPIRPPVVPVFAGLPCDCGTPAAALLPLGSPKPVRATVRIGTVAESMRVSS